MTDWHPADPRDAEVDPPEAGTAWEPGRSYDGPESSASATGIPWQPGQVAPPPTPPPSGDRRTRRWWIAAVVVVVVAAGVVLGVTRPWSGGADPSDPSGPTPSSPVAVSSSGTSSTPTEPPTTADVFVKYAEAGDCVAMTDLLDGSAGSDAKVVDCGDRSTTFTVVKRYLKPKAADPCSSDESVRSARAEAVVCLDRVLAAGQCVLGNGKTTFFVSAVPCATAPAAPFTEVLRLEAVEPAGTPLTCAAGATTAAVSGSAVCVRRVAGGAPSTRPSLRR